MKISFGQLIYTPSDLIRYVASPFASWMDRYYLENPTAVAPDEPTADQLLIAETGIQHELNMLDEFRSTVPRLVEIRKGEPDIAASETLSAIKAKAPIIYQASLANEQFAGSADFLILDDSGEYEIWDAKLARQPKPYYAIQLCCYSEMFAATTGQQIPKRFGIILGSTDKVSFRVEDFIYYYRRVKGDFLAMQDRFAGNKAACPEPRAAADHGRWTSHARKFFEDTDHLVRVAGISVGQIKKLKQAGISTMTALSTASGRSIPKLAADSLEKLVAQARLQCQTRQDRINDPSAPPRYEILQPAGEDRQSVGLAALPPDHSADIFFDMEGYPLISGGLEYLFGVSAINTETRTLEFYDWWAHSREEEKTTFEAFIDWVYQRWKENPGMHIYHYAAYEVSAVRRLSTRHDTR